MARKNSTSQAREIETERPGIINEFLWSCAGVNKAVLRQCPSDYSKYAGIGGMILFTAIMAAISGGYALYFVFNSYYTAGVFGLFWGLLIFNLDRFIVNTMYSDGKHSISWAEIRSGLPRIIMAVFLGLVISTPLEMKIFSDQIDMQVTLDNGAREKAAKKENHILYDELDKYEAQLQKLLDGKKSLENDLNKAQIAYDQEITGPHRGIGPIAAKLESHVEECKSAITRWDATNSSNIERAQKDIERQKERIRILEEQIKSKQKQNGFAIRYEAFKHVTDWDAHPSLYIVSLMITLLFVIIETAPTFLKMMMEDGTYDDMLRAQKYKTKVLADKSISDVNDAVNTCVRISTMKNEKRLEAEIIANEEIMAKIARAQAELLETAIAGWKEIELEKIRQNPSAYVVSLVPPQQEMQVVADEDGNLSEYSATNPGEMAATSSSVIEEAATISPERSPEEMVNAANNTAEDIISKNLASTEANLSEAETNNREQV